MTAVGVIRTVSIVCTACLAACVAGLRADAASIIATGQNNGDPSHTSGNYYFSIDTNTGVATPISPLLSGSSPAGLATVGTQLVGFKDSQHGTIDPVAGVFTPVGLSNGLSITGYEVLGSHGYGVPTCQLGTTYLRGLPLIHLPSPAGRNCPTPALAERT